VSKNGEANQMGKDSQQTSNLRSELLQTLGTVSLVQLNSIGELLLEPSKVVDEGSRVTEMALANTLHLGLVLDSLGIGHRGASLNSVALSKSDSHGEVGASSKKELLLVGLEGRRNGAQVVKDGLVGLDGHLRSKMLASLGRDRLFLEVKVDVVGSDDGIGEEDGVAVDIRSTHVEQPGNLIETRNDKSSNALLDKILAQLLDLLGVGATGGLCGENHELAGRASDAVLPDKIDEVGNGHQGRSDLGQVDLKLVGISYAMGR